MKKKIVALALVICMLAIAIVGGTLAYFTDTEDKTNTFTLGNVDIELTEPNYEGDTDGFLHVYPGQTYKKDPTITVAPNSENCWLVATVTISNREDLYALYENDPAVNKGTWLSLAGNAGMVSEGVAGYDAAGAQANGVSGTMLSKDGADVAFVTYSEDVLADTITYTYYFQKAHAKNEQEVLFEKVTIPSIIDNGDIDGDLQVVVKAYAIQEVGFENVYKAYEAYLAQGD